MDDGKRCYSCKTQKPRTEFYRHPATKDGLLAKCKECQRRDVRANREKNLDYYRAYDRKRGSRQTAADQRKWRGENKQKVRAHNMVLRHIRAGNLTRKPCERCGQVEGVHAHHDDYSKPLDVMWLCPVHHHERHKELRARE